MPATPQLGLSDFRALRRGGWLYVDKSLFVADVLGAPAQVLLYTRPRRFGKTLNLSMLHAFFEAGPDLADAFRDLEIWTVPAARAHFQRYPVVKLTFKDVRHGAWSDAVGAVRRLLAAEVERHATAIESPSVPVGLRTRLSAARLGEGDPTGVLLDLCEALARTSGTQVVLLVDEYDAGILDAWEHGHYDEAVAFFRALLAPALKDNPHLYKGVLTGILRVARESMFSGLNNVAVMSLLDDVRPERFGFTEPEVGALLREFGRPKETDEIRAWYDGYRFGATTVYNPWSIVTMLAFPDRPLGPHWLNTSENALVRSLLLGNAALRADIAALMEGRSVEKEISDHVPLRSLEGDNIWGLLLHGGYLRADASRTAEGLRWVTLSIPNQEVMLAWKGTFRDWLRTTAGPVEPLHAAVLAGDAPAAEAILARMLLRHASAHDVTIDQDEAFYHAFVLGLLVSLERSHFVRSNRESGAGRADVLLVPRRPGEPGVVLEFKRRQRGKELAVTADEALAQIRDRAYDTELEAAGATPIRRLGIAFGGRDVVVRGDAGFSRGGA